jgi:hypothetical protein
MLRDNLVELIEPMLNSAGPDFSRCAFITRNQHRTIDSHGLKNPRPEGAESSLTESALSPFQAEPAHAESRPFLRADSMVDTRQPRCLPASEAECVSHQQHESAKRENSQSLST